MNSLNVIQEIFLVTYAILWGAMLQSLGNLQPFPWNKILSKEKCTYLSNNKQKESRLRHTSLCRLIFSIILLNILPFGSLLLVLNSLSAYNDVIISLKNFPIFFYLLFSSLSVFGYYRFYRVLTKCEWARWLFCDELDIIASEGPEEGDYKGHLIGVVFYWGVPVVMWFILTFY